MLLCAYTAYTHRPDCHESNRYVYMHTHAYKCCHMHIPTDLAVANQTGMYICMIYIYIYIYIYIHTIAIKPYANNRMYVCMYVCI